MDESTDVGQGTLAFPDLEPAGRFVDFPTASLRPHARYHEVWGPIASTRISRVSRQTGLIVEPLVTTTDGEILDGHARWHVAKERGQSSLKCLVLDVNPQEAIEIVIQRHRAADGLNAYARVMLALRLEPLLRKKIAPSKETIVDSQRRSSNLTKREARDVRQDIARIACVSTGNVTKVKQLLAAVVPEIQYRLLCGDVSIHRAWQWRSLSKKAQRDVLSAHLNRRGIKAAIRELVKKHTGAPAPADPVDFAATILRGLATCDPADLAVAVVDIPGRALVVTRACYEEFRSRTDAPC